MKQEQNFQSLFEQELYFLTDAGKAEMEAYRKRGGIISIEPLYPNKWDGHNSFSYRNRSNGVYYGIPLRKNQDGTISFKMCTLGRGSTSFNVENKEQLMQAIFWKYHPWSESAIDAMGEKPRFRINDVEAKAEDKIDVFKKAKDALNIALAIDSNSDEMVDFSRLLGITPENNSKKVIHQLILERAQKDPVKFLNLYNDDKRGIMQIFKRAQSIGLIKYDTQSGYVYKDGTLLGNIESVAINSLKEKTRLLNMVDLESRDLNPANTSKKFEINLPEDFTEGPDGNNSDKKNKKQVNPEGETIVLGEEEEPSLPVD